MLFKEEAFAPPRPVAKEGTTWGTVGDVVVVLEKSRESTEELQNADPVDAGTSEVVNATPVGPQDRPSVLDWPSIRESMELLQSVRVDEWKAKSLSREHSVGRVLEAVSAARGARSAAGFVVAALEKGWTALPPPDPGEVAALVGRLEAERERAAKAHGTGYRPTGGLLEAYRRPGDADDREAVVRFNEEVKRKRAEEEASKAPAPLSLR